jgi:uncharacterized lipoprotein YmbA
MRRLYSLIAILAFSSCATVPSVSRYLLPEYASNEAERSIKVARVELPDYIDHGDIVLELKDGSFHQASFHKWGESLDEGIARLLEGPQSERPPLRVEVVIERFHGREAGGVTLSGKWRERSDEASENSDWKVFQFDESVPKPGYAAMVEAEAKLLGKLRASIVATAGN